MFLNNMGVGFVSSSDDRSSPESLLSISVNPGKAVTEKLRCRAAVSVIRQAFHAEDMERKAQVTTVLDERCLVAFFEDRALGKAMRKFLRRTLLKIARDRAFLPWSREATFFRLILWTNLKRNNGIAVPLFQGTDPRGHISG